jgi:clan AA aspartic protease (TIGR02281 family)
MKNSLLTLILLMFAATPAFPADGDVTELLQRAAELYDAQDYERALGIYKDALRLTPGNTEAYRGMGMSYLKLGTNEAAANVEMIEKAVAAFKELLRLTPDSADVRYQLGLSCLALYDKGCAEREQETLKGLDYVLAGQLHTRIAAYKAPRSFKTLVGGGSSEGSSTRITIVGNSVLVPVTLSHGGRTVQATLVLDTGASCTFISRDLANRLGLDLSQGKRTKVMVADGRVVEGLATKIDHVSVGPKSKNGLTVDVGSEAGKLPFDGLLGMDFLQDFKHSVDFKNQVIMWAP